MAPWLCGVLAVISSARGRHAVSEQHGHVGEDLGDMARAHARKLA